MGEVSSPSWSLPKRIGFRFLFSFIMLIKGKIYIVPNDVHVLLTRLPEGFSGQNRANHTSFNLIEYRATMLQPSFHMNPENLTQPVEHVPTGSMSPN